MCASYKQITETKRYTHRFNSNRECSYYWAHASTLNSIMPSITCEYGEWMCEWQTEREGNVLNECVCVRSLFVFVRGTHICGIVCNSMVFWMPLILNYMCFARLNGNDCRRLFWTEGTRLSNETAIERQSRMSVIKRAYKNTHACVCKHVCARAVAKWRSKISTRKVSFDGKNKENKQKERTHV